MKVKCVTVKKPLLPPPRLEVSESATQPQQPSRRWAAHAFEEMAQLSLEAVTDLLKGQKIDLLSFPCRLRPETYV